MLPIDALRAKVASLLLREPLSLSYPIRETLSSRRHSTLHAVPVRSDPSPGGPRASPCADRAKGQRRKAGPKTSSRCRCCRPRGRLQHQRVRDHRIVLGVRVLLDVQVFLNLSFGIGQKCPLRAESRAEFLQSVVVVGRDRDDLRIRDGNLRIERDQLPMLLMFLRE